MKLFKRIYYPVMALCVTLTVLFGFLSANFTGAPNRLDKAFIDAAIAHAEELSAQDDRNSLHVSGANSGTDAALNLIKSEIEKSDKIQVVDVTTADDGFSSGDVATVGSGAAPTLMVQKTKLNSATFTNLSDNTKTAYIDKRIQNLIVYIPGSKSAGSTGALSADVVLVSVRYDAIGPEATGAAVVGTMIEHIKKLASAAPDFKNDFVFVFADAGLENSVGLYTFIHQFKGLDGITDRIKFAADFDTRGNGGPLVLTDTGSKEQAVVSAVAGNVGIAQASSFVNFFFGGKSGANSVVSGKPAVSFSNIGDLRNQGTKADNMDNLSTAVVRAHAETMESLIVWAGEEDLTALSAEKASDAVYFSYYNLFTVSYPVFVAMVFSGAIIVLLVIAVLLNRKKKAFSLFKVLLGALIQVLSALTAALALFGIYVLVSLLLAGFGVININSMFTLSFVNPGIIISAAAAFAALTVAVCIILKKSFLIKAPDTVRGGVFVSALVAIVLGFVLPQISYPFTLLALLQTAVLLISILVKDGYKAKFGKDIERLFLYVWPSVICMPLFITAISLTAALSQLVLLPILLLMFSLLACGILPYADYLKQSLDKVFKKLPSRVIRYEEEVTEMVEDRAKKGKFSSETHKRITKQKIPWNYTNRFGIIAVTLISGISMLLCASFAGGIEAKIVSNAPTMDNYYYDGAFNYVYSQTDGSRFEVKEVQAYNYIADAGVGMKWNADRGIYEKLVTSLIEEADKPGITKTAEAKRLVYKSYSTSSRIKLTVTGIKNVGKLFFNRTDNQDDFDIGNIYEFVNSTGADKIVFYLPYDYGKYTSVSYESGSLSTPPVSFTFEEQCDDMNNIRANTDIEKLFGNAETSAHIKFNMIFIYQETV